jgi:sialic acid synthase SpsE
MITVDVGSTHLGSYDAAVAWIHLAKKIKAEWLPSLVEIGNEIGIVVYASIWGLCGLDACIEANCKYIKLAYSVRDKELIECCIATGFEKVFITQPFFDDKIPGTISLYTYEIDGKAIYPVTCSINHTGLYGHGKYSGFSSHSLDWTECLNAVKAGAEYIEVHGTTSNSLKCPDTKFALMPTDLQKLVGAVNYYNNMERL